MFPLGTTENQMEWNGKEWKEMERNGKNGKNRKNRKNRKNGNSSLQHH